MDEVKKQGIWEGEWLLSVEVKIIWEDLEKLQKLLQSNPNLRVQEILFPKPDSYEAQVREAMFEIFERIWRVMSRNSTEAIEADLIQFLRNYKQFLDYNPKMRDPLAHLSHIEWIVPDKDMKHKVWVMSIYRQVMRSFYQVLWNWRSRRVDDWRILK